MASGSRSHPRAGSSPHTRGARPRASVLSVELRIIPAYAGSTFARRNVSRRDQDHPRIRGEHYAAHCRGRIRARIIPAYAGSTSASFGRYRVSPDHPRIRGEHLARIKKELPSEGSSPHTRGARAGVGDAGVEMRIIPAYAGSTRGGASGTDDIPGSSPHTRGAPDRGVQVIEQTPDHPRIRGEHR